MLKKLGGLLWIATTPLCLTVLFARPSSAAVPPPRVVHLHHDATPATPAPVAEPVEPQHEEELTNPIQNWFDFSYHNKKEPNGEPEPPPFGMALLNFGVLAFLIGKYGAPNIKKYTRDRHDALARALAEGSRLRDEAKAKLDEYEKKLALLDGEIAKIAADIRTEAEAEKARIIKDAEARAERLKKDAEQQIQAEMQRVRVSIEREVVTAAVAMAEKVLREKTNDTDQKRLAETFIQKVGASR